MLNFERRLPFPVEVVWSAITDPHEREQWFGETTIEAREGGADRHGRDRAHRCRPRRKRMTGRILVWDPPHVLEHEWKQPIVEDGVVRYELHPDGDGTLLRSATAASASATRAGSSAAHTPSWIGWRPTSPATSCPTGRHVAWK